MKIYSFIILSFVLTNPLAAQILKGDILMGGTVAFTYRDNSNNSFSSSRANWNVNVSAGMFVADKFALGLGTQYATQPRDPYVTSTYSFLPFARYYFLPSEQTVNLFLNGSFGFNWADFGQDKKYYSSISFAAGPAFFITDHIAIETTLKYTHYSNVYYSDTRYEFSLNFGFQIHLGD